MELKSTFIVHPETAEQENALKAFIKALKIKFEVSKEEPYDPEFVAKIKESQEEYKRGEFISADKEEIKKLLDSE
jgi:methyl coenzyme M reductase alpha subunit